MIKALILDQDGTIYPQNSSLTDALRERTKGWLAARLNLSRPKVDQIYATLPSTHPHPYLGFLSLGLAPEEYLSEVFDKVDPKPYLSYDPRLVRLFEQLPQKKFVVTLASLPYSHCLQKHLGVFPFIDRTYSAVDSPPVYCKGEIYDQITQDLGLPREQICVVGNSFRNDIQPAIARGYEAIFIGEQSSCMADIPVVSEILALEKLCGLSD